MPPVSTMPRATRSPDSSRRPASTTLAPNRANLLGGHLADAGDSTLHERDRAVQRDHDCFSCRHLVDAPVLSGRLLCPSTPRPAPCGAIVLMAPVWRVGSDCRLRPAETRPSDVHLWTGGSGSVTPSPWRVRSNRSSPEIGDRIVPRRSPCMDVARMSSVGRRRSTSPPRVGGLPRCAHEHRCRSGVPHSGLDTAGSLEPSRAVSSDPAVKRANEPRIPHRRARLPPIVNPHTLRGAHVTFVIGTSIYRTSNAGSVTATQAHRSPRTPR